MYLFLRLIPPVRRVLVIIARLSVSAWVSAFLMACSFGSKSLTISDFAESELPYLPAWQTSYDDTGIDAEKNPWGIVLDEHLSALLQVAVRDNLQLRGNALRVQQALSSVLSADSTRYPIINLEADHKRYQSVNAADDIVYNTSYSLGVATRWELDLWGRMAADTKAARADLAMREYQFQAAKYSLQSQILIAWVNVVEQRCLLQLNQANIAIQRRRLAMSYLRLDSGLVDSVDVRNALQALLRLQATEKDVLLKQDKAQRQLQVLLGRHPSTQQVDTAHLPLLGPFPETRSSPSIVLNRPDILSLEADMLAEGFRWQAAEKRKLPRINVNASYGAKRQNSRDVLDIDWWLGSLTGALVQPVVNRTAMFADAKHRKAEAAIALTAYQHALLEAWQEVENGMQTDAILKSREHLLSLALAQASAAETYTETHYNQGLATSFELLSAQRTRINVETEYTRAQAARIRNRIQLALALGLPAAGDGDTVNRGVLPQ